VNIALFDERIKAQMKRAHPESAADIDAAFASDKPREMFGRSLAAEEARELQAIYDSNAGNRLLSVPRDDYPTWKAVLAEVATDHDDSFHDYFCEEAPNKEFAIHFAALAIREALRLSKEGS
jgi:hypothetical protein